MTQHIILGAYSTSSSFTDSKKDFASSDKRAKWESAKTFLYLAGTFSSANINFDIFSGAVGAVPMWLYLILMMFIGIPYMCMDVFIKQYTGKIDLNENLIPLLKAVNCAIMLQSGVWTIIHACDLSDAVLYFSSCMMGEPPWLLCQNSDTEEVRCVSMLNISLACSKNKIPEENTSHYNYYRKLFLLEDKSIVTRRMFLIALVWIINFFITTLSEPMLMKFFKISFIFRISLSLLFIIYVGILTRQHLVPALKEMISQQNYDLMNLLGHVMYPFGVGLVGVYDFGAMSPFTTVDNAVVAFAVSFIAIAFLRSLIVKILYNLVSKCVKIKEIMHYHYFLMAILPIGSMFLRLQRLIMILIFLIMITTLCPHMAALTCTIVKLLHSEFRSVKNVYFSGLICFFGFMLTTAIALYIRSPWITNALKQALFTSMIFLAFKRIAIIMYIYGVEKFAADIHFWLGFKPTLYWIVSWSIMPVIIFYCVIVAFLQLIVPVSNTASLLWKLWVGFSLLLVLIITLKTIGKYATHNKLLAVLRPSNRYGPPDPDERKRRKRYDETVTVRQCLHDCMPLDDKFDCNHAPKAYKSQRPQDKDNYNVESEISINRIFESDVRKSRLSEMFDAQEMRD